MALGRNGLQKKNYLLKMIKRFRTKDKAEIIKLIQLNTPEYFDASEEKDLSNYLDNEIEDYFVFEENAQIIGCGGINYDENNAVISWDIIHPEHQGKGIGKQLLQHRINFIKSNTNHKMIIVRTSQLTDKFYEKLAFKLEFIKKDYWAKGYDLYQMKLEL